MADIKEKQVIKTPKIMHKVSRMPKEVVRRGLDESIERARQNVQDVQGNNDTLEADAADRLENAADSVTSHSGQTVRNVIGKLRRQIKTRQAYEQAGSDSVHADGGIHQQTESTGVPSSRSGGSSSRQNPRQTEVHTGTASHSGQDVNVRAYQNNRRYVQHGDQARRQTRRVLRETDPVVQK